MGLGGHHLPGADERPLGQVEPARARRLDVRQRGLQLRQLTLRLLLRGRPWPSSLASVRRGAHLRLLGHREWPPGVLDPDLRLAPNTVEGAADLVVRPRRRSGKRPRSRRAGRQGPRYHEVVVVVVTASRGATADEEAIDLVEPAAGGEVVRVD
eukprot:5923680-Pyramimonas_sp.AAC.1